MKSIKVSKVNKHKATGQWYVIVGGKWKYLGKMDTITEIEANEKRQKIIDDLRISTNPPETNEHHTTIAALINFYIANAYIPGDHNKSDRVRYLNAYMAMFGVLRPKELKKFQIQNWMMNQPTWNDTTRSLARRHISAAYNWLIDNEQITSNPVRKLNLPAGNVRGEEYIITPEEYARLLPLVSPVYSDLVELLWHTGCRPKEMLTARGDEYRPHEHVIDKMKKHKTGHKGKSRKIPLDPHAEAIILLHVEKYGNGFLFHSSNGNIITTDVFMDYMRGRYTKAGIVHPVVNYSFRHTAAVRWLETPNISIHTVAAWLGDTVATVEKHYAHTIERIKNTISSMPVC